MPTRHSCPSAAPPALYPPLAARPGDRYAKLLAQLSPRLSEPGSPPLPLPSTPPGELDIQARWFAGEFGTSHTGTDGELIEILSLGHWNHSAGPDFTDAVIRIDGDTRSGAIELDLDARDWEAHGHGADPAFEDVILHLFTSPPARGRFFTRTLSHRAVPQVQLDLASLDPSSPTPLPPDAHPGRCSHHLSQLPFHQVDDLLAEAAAHRLRKKARHMAALTASHGRQEALFQGLAAALGYSHNQLPFRLLAQRLPILTLSRSPCAEPLLFGTAGFIDAMPDLERLPSRHYIRKLWDGWWQHRASSPHQRPLPWCFSGCRPHNHPHRRLGALAAITTQWHAFSHLCLGTRPPHPRQLLAWLANLSHPHWSHHATLRSKPLPKPAALVGSTRAHDLLANVIYPLHARSISGWWPDYQRLPAQLDNHKSSRAAARLLAHHPQATMLQRRLYQQQGLIQLYQDFCLPDRSGCNRCPFPEQLPQPLSPHKST
jgi:hypothetical protein